MGYNEALIEGKEKIAKLFKDKKGVQGSNQRVPPGQVLTTKFPVLDLGVKPDFNRETWRLKVYGLVEKELSLSYDDILKMPAVGVTADFHCVTHWSQLDIAWKGVAWKTLVDFVKPKSNWVHLVQESADGYSTNVPRADLERENVVLVYELEGKPIPREHGWPMRILIPHLYGWKSAKFLKAMRFQDIDTPGFWEVRGYHNHADAWKEERYG